MHQKTVFISGASEGIGRATALIFAENGYHTLLNARSEERLLSLQEEITSNFHTGCDIFPGDISNPETVRNIFTQIENTHLGLDVLVNNAGIAWIGLLSDMTDEEWNHVLNTNLSSVFYCCRSAIPMMLRRKSGKIINISSMWGTSGASCEAAYSASKSGVNGLTKALAKELAPSNIQVNAIACGVIDTKMNSQLSEEERESLSEEIPAGYFASPREAAKFIFHTASAPSYMTGQIIGFDGGFL